MSERLFPGFGRAVLPLLYLLLCGVVSTALHRRGVRPTLQLGVTCAIALTPALLNSSGGAVDTGYSEISMLLATTTIGAGLMNRDPRTAAIGSMLAFYAKPEGLPYVLLAMLVAFGRREPRLIWSMFLSLVIAQLCWGPVAWVLSHRHLNENVYGSYQPQWLMLAVQAALTIFTLQICSRSWLTRERDRWILVLSLPALLLLSLPWTAWLFTGNNNAMSLYLERGQSPYTGFANLLPYAASLLDYGVTSLRLGLTLVLPVVIGIVARRKRIALGDGNVLAFCLLGLAVTALPFVMTIEDDLPHHLRSSLPRLLIHWVGPLWLLSGCWLDTVLRSEHDGSN